MFSSDWGRSLVHGLIAFFLVGGVIVAQSASAQSLPLGSTSEEAAAPAPPQPDPFGRETPRGAVTGLLDALGAEDFDRAANYFSGVPNPLSVLPEAVSAADQSAGESANADDPEVEAALAAKQAEAKAKLDASIAEGAALARQLKQALDSGGSLTPFAALSNLNTGKIDDGLSPDLENVGSLGSGDEATPILLTRSVGPDGAVEWRIAPTTAQAIVAAEKQSPVAETPEVEGLKIAGAPLLDWLKLLAIAIAAFLVFRLLANAILALLRRALADHEASGIYRFLYAALPPLALYAAVITFYLTADSLEVAIVARQTLLRYAGIVAWVALAWFALRLVDGIAKISAARMHRAERRQAVSIITFLRRGAKLLVLAIAAVAVLDTVGLDVTTGIAALGIGGLALALGAQKTIENLVGSITIIADKPVQVGDTAQIGDVFGTVEDIGMRSTRVRTHERTVVSIPNGDLASQRIENFALRDRFLFHQTIGVSYDIDASGMEQALGALRDILAQSDDVIDEEARVRFHGFGDSALDIEIFAYFRTRSFPDSLAMHERLLFAIMRKLDELGVDIAFPTRTLHLRPATPDAAPI